ncbi:MAG: hypothetical protein QN229_00645 [Desulfurococcaceae archaeon TW002]
MLSSEGSSPQPSQKRDIKQLVAVVPPASEVLGRGVRRVAERRVRVRLKEDVPESAVYVSSKLASELGVKEKIQLSVSGRRFVLNVFVSEDVPENEVWANEEFMRRNGISDNSMTTVRSA